MHTPPKSRFLVPFDKSFRLENARTRPPNGHPEKGKDAHRAALDEVVKDIYELQRKLNAEGRYALLLIFQAMDAAGKDSTIRAVMTGVNPAGCQVHSFKAPSHLELDHDFLWRCALLLPRRGTIGIFNRSHYEEVLAVRVHAEYLEHQQLPSVPPNIWAERLESIVHWEQHLARNGTVILKFFLHVSKDEQKKRLLARIDDARKNWKFEGADLDTRGRWNEYMAAYEQALRETSRSFAPWYAVPADDKRYMQHTVATIVREQLVALNLRFPRLSLEQGAELQAHRVRLEAS